MNNFINEPSDVIFNIYWFAVIVEKYSWVFGYM